MSGQTIVTCNAPRSTIVTCGVPGSEFPVALRDASPEDEAVVMRAWLTGHQERGDWPRFVPKGRYFPLWKPVVTRLLAESRTVVACNPQRPSQVLGFICWSGDVLHWLYVKQFMRGHGIAGALYRYAKGPSLCSHWTPSIARRVVRWGLTYNPFLVDAA